MSELQFFLFDSLEGHEVCSNNYHHFLQGLGAELILSFGVIFFSFIFLTLNQLAHLMTFYNNFFS